MAEDVVTVSESVETTIPNTNPITPVVNEGGVDLTSITPAAYADKPWLKDIADVDGLFRLTDSLKSEIGKRPAGIPQDDATPEQWADFGKRFGVPEKAADYIFGEGERSDFQNKMSDALHKAGISQRQLATLNPAFDEVLEGLLPNQEVQDAEFDKMSLEVFGDRKEEALRISQNLLTEHTKDLPEGIKEAINNLPNSALVAVAAVLDTIQSKYINEDEIPTGTTLTHQGMTPEEKAARRKFIPAMPEFKDTSHPDHAKIFAEWNGLYT